MEVYVLQTPHDKMLSPQDPEKGLQGSRRGSSIKSNRRNIESNGNRSTGNGNAVKATTGRNFSFLRYIYNIYEF